MSTVRAARPIMTVILIVTRTRTPPRRIFRVERTLILPPLLIYPAGPHGTLGHHAARLAWSCYSENSYTTTGSESTAVRPFTS